MWGLLQRLVQVEKDVPSLALLEEPTQTTGIYWACLCGQVGVNRMATPGLSQFAPKATEQLKETCGPLFPH